MRCSVFTENIDKLIEEDMPKILVNEMISHMEMCESCRKIYESELLLHKSINDALKIDDTLFKSNKSSIMSKIDANKYKTNGTIYKNLFKFGIPISAAAIFMLLINPTSKLNRVENSIAINNLKDKNDVVDNRIENNKDKKDNLIKLFDENEKKHDKNLNKKSESNIKYNVKEKNHKIKIQKEDKVNNNLNKIETKKVNEKNNIENKDDIFSLTDETQKDTERASGIQKIIIESTFKKIPIKINRSIASDDIKEVCKSWVESPDKLNSFSVYYSKENSGVCIKNENEIYSLNILNQSEENCFKFGKWYDSKNILLICDDSKDKENINEDIYLMNVNKGTLNKIYSINKKEENISSIKIQGKNIKIKTLVNKKNNSESIKGICTKEHIIRNVSLDF